jgi:hypothetical protein
MNAALCRRALAFGVTAWAMIGCNHNTNDGSTAKRPADPHTAAAPSLDERRAAERRAEERRAEDRAQERRAEERAEDRRAEERRAEERAHDRAVGGGPSESNRANTMAGIGRLADARCDREVRCQGVGAHEKYATRAACISKTTADESDDVNVRACPGGINERELEKCIVALRERDCSSPLEGPGQLNACRTANLCVK